MVHRHHEERRRVARAGIGDLRKAAQEETEPELGVVWHFGGPISRKTGKKSGRRYFGRTMSTVAVHDGLVYAAEIGSYFYCLDAGTGKQLGARPEGRCLGIALLGGWQGLHRHRGRRRLDLRARQGKEGSEEDRDGTVYPDHAGRGQWRLVYYERPTVVCDWEEIDSMK